MNAEFVMMIAPGFSPESVTVGEIMSRGVLTVAPLDETAHAANLMSGERVRRLPVLSGGRLVGMLSLGDLARDANCEMEAARALTELSSSFRRK